MTGGMVFARWSAAGAAICAGLLLSTSVFAGAFAVREQSSYYQGMSFAGAAAGDDLSSMFWNSAAAAAAPGINVAAHAGLIVSQREIEASEDSALVDGTLADLDTDSGRIGDPTFVPAAYANYQFSERLFFGVGINGQYGLKTKPENPDFAGTPIATTSEIFSLTVNPNIAYQLTPELTVGVGLQVLYADVRLRSSNTPAALAQGGADGREVEVDDWAFGGTLGVVWNPAPGTRIGVGYRSNIKIEAEGTCSGFGLSNLLAGGSCLNDPSVTAELTLPDLVTASFSQHIGERWRVLGTVEWTNWSRVPAEAEFVSDGDVVDVFPLDYDDGWFFSGGVEYAWRPDTILRAGLGYELSPIDDEIRNVALPDDERIWLSVGASMQISGRTTLDFGYSHLFVEDSPISESLPDDPNLGPLAGATLFEGEANGDIDIFTLGLTHNFGGPEPALEPLK